MKKLTKQEAIQRVQALCAEYNVSKYEITEIHAGNCLKHGALKKLVIYDRFIPDTNEFNELGYNVFFRNSDEN